MTNLGLEARPFSSEFGVHPLYPHSVHWQNWHFIDWYRLRVQEILSTSPLTHGYFKIITTANIYEVYLNTGTYFNSFNPSQWSCDIGPLSEVYRWWGAKRLCGQRWGVFPIAGMQALGIRVFAPTQHLILLPLNGCRSLGAFCPFLPSIFYQKLAL